MYYSIGEFSKLTNLTQKTLRLYQEKELLIPAKIDEFTKYRFYNDSNLETANLINFFKQFDFSLAEIKEIVDNQDDRSIVAELLEKQRDVIEDKITKYNFVMGLINEKLKRRNTMTEMNSASKQRSRFWKIFAKLLMSNIPIAESLEIAGKSADEETKAVLPDIIAESLLVAGKSADEETKAVLPEIINEVKQGNKLSDSLKKFNTVFTNLEILVITTAEKDNHIAECANGLGDILDEFGFPDKNEERKNTRSNYWKIYSALIDLGNTIVNTMPVAAEWADEKIRETTDAMLNELYNGSDISTTLESRPDAFTKLELEIVRAGERTGNLDKAIKSLQPVIRMIEETDSETVKRKVFWNELGFFLMLTALPLTEILEISLNFADDKLKAMSKDILKEIADKKTLSSIMQKHPGIFQEFETRMIALGEKNGNVWKTALDIADIL
jgi:type II secretory pathway component PulF